MGKRKRGNRPSHDMKAFRDELDKAKHIVILTGAGVSAESGVPTFRGAGGYWRKWPVQDLASADAFDRNPSLIWEFYHFKRENMLSKFPNLAHEAIAACESRLSKQNRRVTVITQNIDELHRRAGSERYIELHGNLFKVKCLQCGEITVNRKSPLCEALRGKGAPDLEDTESRVPLDQLPRCEKSECGGLLRPHVVFFGEDLEEVPMEAAKWELDNCDLCLLVGTSSIVYPACEFAPKLAKKGITVAEFNIEQTSETCNFKYHFNGPCGATLPVALEPTASELSPMIEDSAQEFKHINPEFQIVPYSSPESQIALSPERKVKDEIDSSSDSDDNDSGTSTGSPSKSDLHGLECANEEEESMYNSVIDKLDKCKTESDAPTGTITANSIKERQLETLLVAEDISNTYNDIIEQFLKRKSDTESDVEPTNASHAQKTPTYQSLDLQTVKQENSLPSQDSKGVKEEPTNLRPQDSQRDNGENSYHCPCPTCTRARIESASPDFKTFDFKNLDNIKNEDIKYTNGYKSTTEWYKKEDSRMSNCSMSGCAKPMIYPYYGSANKVDPYIPNVPDYPARNSNSDVRTIQDVDGGLNFRNYSQILESQQRNNFPATSAMPSAYDWPGASVFMGGQETFESDMYRYPSRDCNIDAYDYDSWVKMCTKFMRRY